MSVNSAQVNICSQMCYDCHENINNADNMIEWKYCEIKLHRYCSRALTSTYRNNSYC